MTHPLDSVDFEDAARVRRLVAARRDLHRHPELGFEETRTAGVVAAALRDLDIPAQTGVAKTGVLGLIEGRLPGPTVLLRADMDALPLTEVAEHDYSSEAPGKMHACGHDAHVAILLETARVLHGLRDRLPGRVKLCFQPAEEGPGGAEPMIAAGALEDPRVDFAFGLHVWNNLPRGEVGLMPGPIMAAADTFDCRITARGGHGAAPHQTPDPIVAAAAAVQAWQALLSRESDPLQPTVLSVCRFDGGTTYNVIPSRVHLQGTVRTFDPAARAEFPARMERVLDGVASAYGCGHRFDWRAQYPATVNDPRVVDLVREVLAAMPDRLADSPAARPCMGAEDMSFFLREVPGAFVFLGSGRPGDADPPPHHNEAFDIDEGCLPRGVELMCRVAWRLLEAGAPTAPDAPPTATHPAGG